MLVLDVTNHDFHMCKVHVNPHANYILCQTSINYGGHA